MDPAALAATVTGLLAPFLARIGDAAIGEVGARLPEKVGKVWSAVAARFQGNPTASGAASDLARNADDTDNQETFALQLRKTLKDDPEFAGALADLLKDAQASINNAGDGAVAANHSTAVGNLSVGGNMTGNIVIGNKNQVGDRNPKTNT